MRRPGDKPGPLALARPAWLLLAALLWALSPQSALASGFTPVERTLPLVVDDAGLLTADEEERLNTLYERLSEEQRCEIAVVTVDGLGGKTPEAYADDFFDYNGYGYGLDDDGLLLLVSMADRDWHLTTHGRARDQMDEARFHQLTDEVVSLLSQGSYYDAFEAFGYNAARMMEMPPPSGGAVGPYPVEVPHTPTAGEIALALLGRLGLSLLIGAVAAAVVNVSQAAKHRTVRMREGAQGYLVSAQTQAAAAASRLAGDGSAWAAGGIILAASMAQALLLRGQDDTYLYTSTNRVRRSSEDSGSGGGGFGGHSSSSGRSHGGGGGKF